MRVACILQILLAPEGATNRICGVLLNPAEQAARIGLVNEFVSPDRLMPQARALAMQIAQHSPAAVRACLESVTRGLNLTIDEGLAVEADRFARMVPTEDIREGIRAFIERRSPQFTGA